MYFSGLIYNISNVTVFCCIKCWLYKTIYILKKIQGVLSFRTKHAFLISFCRHMTRLIPPSSLGRFCCMREIGVRTQVMSAPLPTGVSVTDPRRWPFETDGLFHRRCGTLKNRYCSIHMSAEYRSKFEALHQLRWSLHIR